VVRPNSRGRIAWHENLRASISRWFFEDRLTPVTNAMLASGHHDEVEEQEHIAEGKAAEIASQEEKKHK